MTLKFSQTQEGSCPKSIQQVIEFAPKDRKQLYMRNATIRLMGLPFVSKLVMARSLRDPIELPSW